MEIIRKKVQVYEEIDIDRISEFVTMTSDELKYNQDASDNAAGNKYDGSMNEDDSAIGRVLNMGRGSNDARIAHQTEFGNDNTSGGLASFLHDNLLLSDVN